MATLTVRVEDHVRDQLQAVADGRGVSVSDVLRSLIESLFDRTDRGVSRPAAVPESLTMTQRRTLSLLHRILARLIDEDATGDDRLGEDGDTDYQLDRAQALEHGWAAEYDMEFIAIRPELSRRECGLVMDILDMFRVLRASTDRVAEQPGSDELAPEQLGWLTFRGFDLNDDMEGRMLTYARALVSGDRWTELADAFSADHDRGNSHHRLLPTYQRMLGVFDPIWQTVVHRGRSDYLLTAQELAQVAAAAQGAR